MEHKEDEIMWEAFRNYEQGNSVKRFLVKAKAISKVRHTHPRSTCRPFTILTFRNQAPVALMWEWERTRITIPVAAGKNTPKTVKKDSPGL